MDRIRVLRIIEYVGPRDAVEEQIKRSLHGTRAGGRSLSGFGHCDITAMTLGLVPEVLGTIAPGEPLPLDTNIGERNG